MLSNSQPFVSSLSSIRLKSQMLEMQILGRAQRESIRHVEARRPPLRLVYRTGFAG